MTNESDPPRGNTMILNLPGLEEPLSITFPHRRLPVCAKCKGHFKTRDLCRLRKMHTSLPWNTVFLCISLDSSCTDENNKLFRGPFRARTANWQPFEFKKTTKMIEDMPMCLECKNKNYTGSSCRGGINPHRHLPWSTVYIELFCPKKNQSKNKDTGKEDSNENDKVKEKSIVEKHTQNDSPNVQGKENECSLEIEGALSDQEEIVSGKRKIIEDDQPSKKRMKNGDTSEDIDNKCDEQDSNDNVANVEKSRAFFVKVSHVCFKLEVS